jgi:hypothetical protein
MRPQDFLVKQVLLVLTLAFSGAFFGSFLGAMFAGRTFSREGPPSAPGEEKPGPEEPGQEKAGKGEKPRSGAKSLLGALPQDILLLLRVGGAKGFLEKLRKSPFHGLKEEPAVRDLLLALEAELRGVFPEALRDSGFDPVDLLRSVEGEGLIAVGSLDPLAAKLSQALSAGASPSLKPEDVSVVLALDAGDCAAKVREHLERIFVYAERQGFKRESEELEGGRLTTLGGLADSSGEKKEKRAYRASWTFGDLGRWFFVGPRSEFLKSCMSRMKKAPLDSLAGDSRFQASQKGLGGEPDLSLFLNLKLLASFVQSSVSNSLPAFYWPRFHDLLIGKSSNSLAASFSLEERGIKASVFVENGGGSDGLVGLFRAEPFSPFSPGPPGVVPSEVGSYTTLGFSPKRLEEIVKTVAQTAISILGPGGDPDLWFEQSLGVKLKDLTGALSGRLYVFEQGRGEPKAGVAVALLLDLSDEAPFKKLFEKLSEPTLATLVAEKYKDHDIYSIYSRRLDKGGGLWCSVFGKTLAAVTFKDDLERLYAAGRSSPGLSANEDFRKATQGLPPRLIVFSYSSPMTVKRSLESLFGSGGRSEQEPHRPLQGGRLLAAEQIYGALGPCMGYMVWQESGLYGEEWLLYQKR